MRSALIGSTGFIGSTLSAATRFEEQFNSRNIDEIRGKSFDLIVCAGMPAAKWIANRDPDTDLTNALRLLSATQEANAEHFVLISTIDVYPTPVGVDELNEIGANEGNPYGRHRLLVERVVASSFGNVVTLRLPALFGPGLRKNVIYDLLNDNQIDAIHPESSFQWFDVRRLWPMTETLLTGNNGLLLNVATEPIATQTIADRLFAGVALAGRRSDPVAYDVRTIHTKMFQREGPYLLGADEVLEDLGRFVHDVQEGAVSCGSPYQT